MRQDFTPEQNEMRTGDLVIVRSTDMHTDGVGWTLAGTFAYRDTGVYEKRWVDIVCKNVRVIGVAPGYLRKTATHEDIKQISWIRGEATRETMRFAITSDAAWLIELA